MLAATLRHAPRSSPTLLLARHGARALASRPPPRRGPPQTASEIAMNEDDKKVDKLIGEKLHGYTPRLRGPAPPAPAWLHESWVPAASVSADPLENALEPGHTQSAHSLHCRPATGYSEAKRTSRRASSASQEPM